ncbi:MAG: hypothetical protein M3O70_26970 [Actinomycetota bacterium]|nr:hypothetical protein [Actinomycetota bacterium]
MWKPMATVALSVSLALSGCGDDSDDTTVAPTTPPQGEGNVFSTLDRNGDSYLDVDEVAEWEDREGIFTRWDADADSELDRDEVAGNAFSLWDADDSGKISQAEWRQGTNLWYPQDVELRVYSDWDRDGDSELDTDEFKERFDFSALGESWSAESLDKESFKKAYFELYDTDDDGRVSVAEWTQGSRTFGIAE